MRAAIFRNGEIVVDQLPEPKPGPGMVLVKSLACGICGSDLHARKHAHRMVELSKYFPGRKPMDLSRDVVFGHEFCCEVLDYGPATARKFKAGTRVCSLPALLTAQGPQGIGYSNDNVGAYAERMLLSEALLLEVPNGLAAGHAALTEPLAVGVHAVAKANISGNEVPLVIGCGPVGLAVIAALRLRGVPLIVASDFSPTRRAHAKKLGAHIVVDPSQAEPVSEWRAAGGRGPTTIFDAVGVPGMIEQAMIAAPSRSEILVVGLCMRPDTFRPAIAINKELQFTFVLGWTAEEFSTSLEAIAEGTIDAGALITGEVGLDDVAHAFDELANPDHHIKILVLPNL